MGSAQLNPAQLWRLQQWTDELCNSDGYNSLMKVGLHSLCVLLALSGAGTLPPSLALEFHTKHLNACHALITVRRS